MPTGTPPQGTTIPVYEPVKPSQENRWRLAPKVIEGGFEAWPGLDELFPFSVQGVNHNRGVDGSVIDTDRATLVARMKRYIEAKSFGEAASECPDLAPAPKDGRPAIAGYDPEAVWGDFHAIRFSPNKVVDFLRFHWMSGSFTVKRKLSC